MSGLLAIRTPAGAATHLAGAKWGRPIGQTTYCGRVLHKGIDTIEAYDETTHDPTLCQSCAQIRSRRARRAEGARSLERPEPETATTPRVPERTMLEGPDPTKPATPPWAPRAQRRRSILEDLSPAQRARVLAAVNAHR